MKYDLEYTDTLGGEANYSWVRRATIDTPSDISDLALVRRAKRALGLSGVACKRDSLGDMMTIRPYGTCTIAFITPNY